MNGINKKGLSSVITVTLIVLGTIIGAVLLWAFISKAIQRGGDVVDPDCLTVNLEVTRCDIQGGCFYLSGTNYHQAEMLVKRNVGKGNVTGLRFVFEDSVGLKRSYDWVLGSGRRLGELESISFEDEKNLTVSGYQSSVKVAALIGSKGDVCPIASKPRKCNIIGPPPVPVGAFRTFNNQPNSFCCMDPPQPGVNSCYNGLTQGYGINASGQLVNGYPEPNTFNYTSLCCQ